MTPTTEELRALRDRATKGPWQISKHVGTMIETATGRGIASAGGYSSNVDSERIFLENHANAALIALAPDLADEVIRLRAERDADQAQIQGLSADNARVRDVNYSLLQSCDAIRAERDALRAREADARRLLAPTEGNDPLDFVRWNQDARAWLQGGAK